jgi:uncharacterized lipoprotein YddW (UPF0748 family)
MLERLASVPAAQKLYQQPQPQQQQATLQADTIQWRAQAVRQYIQRIDRFLKLLCLAVHIAGSQPARRPELLSVR